MQDSELCENIPGCHDMIEIVKHDIQVEEHSDIEEQVVEENNEVNENDEHNDENEEFILTNLSLEEAFKFFNS